jgi:hypothetical protein
MAQLDFFLVCESYAIDKQTNRLSIFNVLENIGATRFPAIHQLATAITLLRIEEGDYDQDMQLMLTLTKPGQPSQSFPLNFRFERGKTRHRLIQGFSPIELTQAGHLTFAIALNGAHFATYRVPVTLTPEPRNAQAS